jgi:uncharacterized protein YdiU (UPF0061 family)
MSTTDTSSPDICNHSDGEGRYSFRNQPTMGVFAIDKLGRALSEMIGYEASLAQADPSRTGYVVAGKAWGEEGEKDGKMAEWKKDGLEKVEDVKKEFVAVFTAEYTRLMRLVRLYLPSREDGD